MMAIPISDIRISSLGRSSAVSGKKIAKVSLLGCGEQLKWKQKDNALVIEKSCKMYCNYVLAYKLKFAA